MADKNNQYVVRHDDKWAVRGENKSRVSREFDTQKEAINYGRNQAKKHNSELRIQGSNGKFRDSDSYGNDPRSSKDTKF
jgi:hypothetical protein